MAFTGLPGIHHFMWRACTGILATRETLARRLHCNPIWPLCGFSSDSISHALLACSFAKQVWKLLPWSDLRRAPLAGSFLDYVWFIMEFYSLQDLQHLAITTWAIWNMQNQLVFNDTGLSAAKAIQRFSQSIISIEASCLSIPLEAH